MFCWNVCPRIGSVIFISSTFRHTPYRKRPSTQVPSIPAVSSASRRVEAIMRNVWSDSNSPVTATVYVFCWLLELCLYSFETLHISNIFYRDRVQKRTTIAPFSASRPRPEHTSTAQLPTSASPYIRPPSKLIQPQKSISTAGIIFNLSDNWFYKLSFTFH